MFTIVGDIVGQMDGGVPMPMPYCASWAGAESPFSRTDPLCSSQTEFS